MCNEKYASKCDMCEEYSTETYTLCRKCIDNIEQDLTKYIKFIDKLEQLRTEK